MKRIAIALALATALVGCMATKSDFENGYKRPNAEVPELETDAADRPPTPGALIKF